MTWGHERARSRFSPMYPGTTLYTPALLRLKSGENLMTLNELIILSGNHTLLMLVVFVLPPVVTLLLGLSHGPGKGEEPPRCYFYAVLIYMTCLPGLFALTLTAYSLFFTKQNLLDVNLLVYLLPILSMGLTLSLMARKISFDDIPGFERISGLMIILTATFAVLFFLSRTRIWLLFSGSFLWLLAIGIIIFIILQLSVKLVTQARN